jgi:small neutral amino acid transporter SnatA (MarC family)
MIASRLWRAGLALVAIGAAAFIAVAPPERCPSVTTTELRDSAQASVEWFVRNQDADGSWLYLYDAEEDSSSAEYNEVRHAGVTMGLYQAAAAGLPGALESADRGLGWAIERVVERDGWAAIEYFNEVNTGATALLAAGLTIRREATGDPRYDQLLRRLGRFLLAQTETTGAVLANYDLTTGAPEPGLYSKYYTGEAYWALARLHRAFPGEAWGEAADLIGAYLATERDEAEDHWPPIPDHWAAYGAAETVEFPERAARPLTDDEADYAGEQAELFGPQARWVAQRFGPWGGLVRGTYTPRGGGYGVISEALTGWWLAAQAEPRLAELREPLADRATCVAGLAIEAQSDGDDAADAARPDRVEGAWFIDGETRMDDQQHALAGLLRTIPIVEAQGSSPAGSSDSDDDAPSGWLWATVLLLLLNPARAAFGVPRSGRSERDVIEVAAAGGAIGGLAICAAAAVGDPLLDLLDVSDPSFRTAAGIVAALAGAIDLFRRPPLPEPALAGWRAALIPVAIPVVARPALLVVALGAGADQGVLVSAAAIAVGVATLVGLVSAGPPDDTRGRVLRWAGRLLAAALVAGGIILTLDGIMAV